MKRRVLFLFSVAIVLIAVICALTSCEAFWQGDKSTTTTAEKRIPPSERDPEVDQLNLDYSENFDEYDIEFIKNMRTLEFSSNPGNDPKPDFNWAMEQMSRENNTFYKVNVNLDNVLYFIAAYENTSQQSAYWLEAGGVIEWHKFCKYEDYESIPENIGDWTLIGNYAVYDCVVEKDILNNVVYNHSCKYYVPLTEGYSEAESKSTYDLYETVIWADVKHYFGRSAPITILHTFKFDYFYGKDIYRYDIDENGVEYLVFSDARYPVLSIVDEMWKK